MILNIEEARNCDGSHKKDYIAYAFGTSRQFITKAIYMELCDSPRNRKVKDDHFIQRYLGMCRTFYYTAMAYCDTLNVYLAYAMT